MLNYDLMAVELEQQRDELVSKMMASNDEAEIEELSLKIDEIEDMLNDIDPFTEA